MTTPRIVFRLVVVLGLGLHVATRALGQPAPVPATVPELFAGELDDVGPQYLLLAAPRRTSVELWADVELSATSNATLVEQNPKSSTITSAQAGATWTFKSLRFQDGQLDFETGLRAQAYRYGIFAGRKQKINFLEIDRNDFDLLALHVGAHWSRDHWLAATTLRATALRNRTTRQVFYREAACEAQVFRQGRFSPHCTWAVGVDTAVRLSKTDSFGLLPAGWNDRVESAVVGVVERALGAHWRLQPALRVQGTQYTHRGRHRSDVHGSSRLDLIYGLAVGTELRLGAGYDRRDSSEPLIADFAKYDLGVSGRAQWRF